LSGSGHSAPNGPSLSHTSYRSSRQAMHSKPSAKTPALTGAYVD
ncbi:unnamed protein product, partial [Mycena citricolor]